MRILWLIDCFSKYNTWALHRLLDSNLTSADVKAACEDLKVLGKKDFKTLLKWRVAVREQVRTALGLAKCKLTYA